jgi:ketosteroid isomerase-like protein
MSENLDLVRSIYAGWERGDFFSWNQSADPEIEWVSADGPSPGQGKGLAGWYEDLRDWLSAWEDYCVKADEYRELDGERVLAFHYRSGRGKTSGLDVEQMGERGANVFHVRDGKVTRLVAYTDCERALADLGLKE